MDKTMIKLDEKNHNESCGGIDGDDHDDDDGEVTMTEECPSQQIEDEKKKDNIQNNRSNYETNTIRKVQSVNPSSSPYTLLPEPPTLPRIAKTTTGNLTRTCKQHLNLKDYNYQELNHRHHQQQLQQQQDHFHFQPNRIRSTSMTYSSRSAFGIAESLSMNTTSLNYTNTPTLSMNHQRSMSLNHSQHSQHNQRNNHNCIMESMKLNQNQIIPTTPSTATSTRSMSTSISQGTLSSYQSSSQSTTAQHQCRQSQSHSSSSKSKVFNHDLVNSPFTTPLLLNSVISNFSMSRSEDSYERLLQPLNETFQRNLQDFNNNSRKSRSSSFSRRKRKLSLADDSRDEDDDDDQEDCHFDYNNINYIDEEDDVNNFNDDDSFVRTNFNQQHGQDHERCFICSNINNNDFFLTNLGRWGMKLLGFQVPLSPFIDEQQYQNQQRQYFLDHHYEESHLSSPSYELNAYGCPSTNNDDGAFVSYNCDSEDHEDYDKEIAQLNQASKRLDYCAEKCEEDQYEYYDVNANEESDKSRQSPLLCNDGGDGEEGDDNDDQHGESLHPFLNKNSPPLLPDLGHHVQSTKSSRSPNEETLSPRTLYRQYDSDPNASKYQHPLLCHQSPNCEPPSSHYIANGEKRINLSWATVSPYSPRHHLFDSSSETNSNYASLSSSKCEQQTSPKSTTSPLIHHPLSQSSDSRTNQSCHHDSSGGQQGSSDYQNNNTNSFPRQNRDSITTTSTTSPKHHLLSSTVATLELNVELEWQQQASKHEEAGDYTRALYFYGLCLEQAANQPSENSEDVEQSLNREKTISVISLLHKIGIIQWKIGSYDLSIKALEEALEKARSLIAIDMMQDNFDDPLCCREEKECLAEILNSVGRTYVSQGSYDIAMDYHVESLTLLKSIQSLSLNSDEASISQSTVIDVHDEKSLIQEEELFEKLNHTSSGESQYESHKQEEAMKLSLHPGIARTMICIGTIQDLKGNYNVAMARFRDGYEIQRKTVGPDHVDIGTTLNAIGSVYEKIGDHLKAMRCYKKAHKVYKNQLGVMHVDVAVTLNNIGQVYHALKKYKKAMNVFNEALRIMTSLLGDGHRNVATTLFNKALVYKTCGNYDKALKILKDTLSSQRTALGEYHADVALTLESLGDVHEQMGNVEKAKSLIHKALKVRRKTLGENHVIIAMTLDKLGQLYLKDNGDMKKAVRRFREALKCYRLNNFDEQDPKIVQVLQNLKVATSTRNHHF